MSLSDPQELLERYGDQLRAKISSKFTASIFLAGFAGIILSSLLASLWTSGSALPEYFGPALALSVGASVILIHAVIRLDELSMPKRFWPSHDNAQRTATDVGLLTQNDLWALQHRMVFYWTWLTLLGTILTGLAFLVLLIPQDTTTRTASATAVFGWPASAAVLAFIYARILDFLAPDRGKLVRPKD